LSFWASENDELFELVEDKKEPAVSPPR